MDLKPFLFVLAVFKSFTWLGLHVTVGNVRLAPPVGLAPFESSPVCLLEFLVLILNVCKKVFNSEKNPLVPT